MPKYNVDTARVLRAYGLSNIEIARQMGVSPQWISKHLPRTRLERPWTHDDLDVLAMLRTRGKSWTAIGRALNRPANACAIRHCREMHSGDAVTNRHADLAIRMIGMCMRKYGVNSWAAVQALRKSDAFTMVRENFDDLGLV